MEYKALEPTSLVQTGITAPSFDGTNASFLATSTFIYSLFFTAIVGAAFYRYVVAGTLRLQASEATIRQSNEIIKRVTLGLLGVFSLFLILFTVNKGLVTGDIGLSDLKLRGTSGSASTVTTNPSDGTVPIGNSGRSCEAPGVVLARLSSGSGDGVCAGSRCTALDGCSYNQFLPIIKDEASTAGIDYKIVVAIMCRESRGVVNPPQRSGALANSDGSFDCGLMQINRKSKTCEPEILDPRTNIRAGIAELKKRLNNAIVTPGAPALANVFADYNCCANGVPASSPSNDCTVANGFPSNFPKWACPINPGTGTFNMCAVKDYACGTYTCINNIP